jgi:hypothetical protein
MSYVSVNPLQDLEPEDNDEVITREEKSTTATIPVVSMKHIVLNLFAAERFLTGLFRSREKVLTQAREGKRGYFTFSYPGLGWAQYDHNSIEVLFRLASSRSAYDLAVIHLNEKLPTKHRLHAIAALLIKQQDEITKLYYGARRARNTNYQPRTTVVFFKNPFRGIFYTNQESIMLNGKEIIQLQETGHRLKFQPFIPRPREVRRAIPQSINVIDPNEDFVDTIDPTDSTSFEDILNPT